jgi:hypothetical protein
MTNIRIQKFFLLLVTDILYLTNKETAKDNIIGYFERIYKWENLTFHLQTEKDVKFVIEMMC